MAGCAECGFIWNLSYDEASVAYNETYEATQIHSPQFRSYLESTALAWLDRIDTPPVNILEVGCGQGEFLEALSKHTSANLVGYDPAFRGIAPKKVKIISEKLPDHPTEQFDVVINRMTLEHIPAPRSFITSMTRWLAPDGTLITQVPNAAKMIQNGLICDLYYEHVNYFTIRSLNELLRFAELANNDFDIGFDEQHLTAFSRKSACLSTTASTDPVWKPDYLAAAQQEFLNYWRVELERLRAAGRSIWIWGTGSRATTFMSLLPNSDLIDGAIDINPIREGSYILGTGCMTHLPSRLRGRSDLAVIIMNPIYANEIKRELTINSASAEIVLLGI